MTITHDTSADAVYVSLTKECIDKTVKLNDFLTMDIDHQGTVVGLEILDAASQKRLITDIRKGIFKNIFTDLDSITLNPKIS